MTHGAEDAALQIARNYERTAAEALHKGLADYLKTMLESEHFVEQYGMYSATVQSQGQKPMTQRQWLGVMTKGVAQAIPEEAPDQQKAGQNQDADMKECPPTPIYEQEPPADGDAARPAPSQEEQSATQGSKVRDARGRYTSKQAPRKAPDQQQERERSKSRSPGRAAQEDA